MKYVLFEKSAVEHLINSRFFQTSEYTQGQNLASFIRGERNHLDQIEGVFLSQSFEGAYFIGEELSKTFLVIDLIQSKLLEEKSVEETVQILQKMFRFSIKYWNKMFFTPSELVLTDANKAIIFPFPYSRGGSFRIVLEREPDAERTIKRGIKQTLLVYKSGYDGTPPQIEHPVLSNFRLAIDQSSKMSSVAKKFFENKRNHIIPELRPLEIIEIQDSANKYSRVSTQFISYSQWQKIITNKQKSFIERSTNNEPMRLEGPAGTGKTMTLILKAYYLLDEAFKKGEECRIIFFAHSKATQLSINNIFETVSMGRWIGSENYSSQSIEITTLHEYCIDKQIETMHLSEVLERDALSSKQLQYYAISEAFDTVMNQRYKTYKALLSASLQSVLDDTENKNVILGMLQHEFSIMIKGKAASDLDKYKELDSLLSGLQLINKHDKDYIFQIFTEYQNQIELASQFDTDDVVLTAIGRLDSPLWRRRRKLEGYDYIFIDETHLFNQNETMVFHHLTKDNNKYPFIFSIDISQAIGDQGLQEIEFAENYKHTNNLYKQEYGLVFRSSQAITDLAMTITASGAILFGNFKNPYKNSISAFTNEEELLSRRPEYILKLNDEEMITSTINLAKEMKNSMKCSESEIAIISFSESLHSEIQKQMAKDSYVLIEKRGDLESKNKAKEQNSFILSLPEYIGGMEFHGVILIGVDSSRVPPLTGENISRNYLSFAAYNKLYVAITRARYQVFILGSEINGSSSCLEYSLTKETLIKN